MNTSGNSIAAAADAVTRNGKKNYAIGWISVVAGGIIIFASGYCIRHYFNNKGINVKHRNAKDLAQQKHHNSVVRDKQRAENKIKEMERKFELKKDFIDFKKAQTDRSLDFDTTDEANLSSDDVFVSSYDEIISGEEVFTDDLRLGLRNVHLGEDCGLIGRTQIGKTTYVIQYAIALARGYQEEDAKLTPDWKLSQPMTVLYFAFEQDRTYFKSKYGKFLKDIPNLFIELKTDASDFKAIQRKIKSMQNSIGNRRLLVVFDNITKMKYTGKDGWNAFSKWLSSYRNECASKGVPITYLKVYHTQGRYRDDMPLDTTTNYGIKTDSFFSQSLVGFGMCKGRDGKRRYIKELKNKFEQDGEKHTLSVYTFAGKEVPMFNYVEEAEEYDVLPSKAELVRGIAVPSTENVLELNREPRKRGRKENLTEPELQEIAEELKAGFLWREILEYRGFHYGTGKMEREKLKNKTKSIREGFKRYNIDWPRAQRE